MKRSDELKQQRSAILDKQQALVDARNEAGEKDFTEEQAGQWDALQARQADLLKQIQRAEQEEALALHRTDVVVNEVTLDNEAKDWRSLKAKYSLHKALRAVDADNLTGAEAEVQQELVRRAKEAGKEITGIAVPMSEGRADQQTVTQDSGNYGGNLVQADVQPVIDFLRPNPVVESMGATVLRGLTGDLVFPWNKGGVVAAWEGEVDANPLVKNQYDKKTMKPHRLQATVGLSWQNLLQSTPDLELLTIAEINKAIATALDIAAINGPGTTAPEGILNNSDAGALVKGVNGGAPTWADVVALQALVSNGNYNINMATTGYLINPNTMSKLKTTEKASNTAAFIMQNGEIDGYKVGVSNVVPNDLTKGTADPVSAAVFGDFSQLYIGQWGFMDAIVDRVTQKKNAVTEVTINSFFDIMLRHAEAFAHVKDWDLS